MEVTVSFEKNIAQLLERHPDVLDNPSRQRMIREGVDNREAIVSATGALATWTPCESNGRSPKDTYIVRRKESEANIDWDSPNNIPLDPGTFDMLVEEDASELSRLVSPDGKTIRFLVLVTDMDSGKLETIAASAGETLTRIPPPTRATSQAWAYRSLRSNGA